MNSKTLTLTTNTDLIDWLNAHGVDAWDDKGQLKALNVFSQDGERHTETVTLPTDFQAVKRWMGY